MTDEKLAVPEGREPAAELGIDPEHTGDDRALLQTFYAACLEEGGTADEITLRGLRAVLALWGNPTPSPLADTHYEWELEDAQGEWQAGGSSNSQSDVEREGIRYLQTYAQDGAHKLIIRQHTTQTINEITHG